MRFDLTLAESVPVPLRALLARSKSGPSTGLVYVQVYLSAALPQKSKCSYLAVGIFIIRCQVSDVRRSGSSRPPFIFIDATDEEPQDHDYHIQQGPDRGHHEHARAERGIEISEPA